MAEAITNSQSFGAAPQPPARTAADVRIGLAFSGGGFRASLFHLGTLTRLAELDLLRHVSVLSTVSGGSVIAAHYMLYLKQALDGHASGTLTRDEYIALVKRLQDDFTGGMRNGLRNRMLVNPLKNFRMLYGLISRTGWRAGLYRVTLLRWTFGVMSLTERMVDLYQRFLFRSITESILRARLPREYEGIPLHRMKVLPVKLIGTADIEQYNRERATDRIPRLVLNSACLNTGRKFLFTFVEVGDHDLGFLRYDERWLVLSYKRLLELATDAAWSGTTKPGQWLSEQYKEIHDSLSKRVASAKSRRGAPDPRDSDAHENTKFPGLTPAHLVWWIAIEALEAAALRKPSALEDDLPDLAGEAFKRLPLAAARELSEAVDRICEPWGDALTLARAPFGVLRRAKIAAWYLLDDGGWRDKDGRPIDRRDDYKHEEHRERFWRAIGDIDPGLLLRLRGKVRGLDYERLVYALVLDLYYFRSARVFSWSAGEVLERLTITMGAAASANFPPVFAPYRIHGLYEPKLVKNVALSDGGLNDNQGIETLMEEECTHVIASDAGEPRQPERSIALNRAGMLAQILVNSLTIVQNIQLRALRESQRVTSTVIKTDRLALTAAQREALGPLRERYSLESEAFFQLGSNTSEGLPAATQPPPPPAHPLADLIAPTRTDLDAFGEIECDALVYQGYQLCDRFVRRYVLLPDLIARLEPRPAVVPAALNVPYPGEDAERWRHARVLKAAHSIAFRALAIRWFRGEEKKRLWAIPLLVVVLFTAPAWWQVAIFRWHHTLPPIQGHLLEYALLIGKGLLLLIASSILALTGFGLWMRIDGILAWRAAKR
jgi:predicted acylesterase/phospholipase RssA